MKGSQLVSLKRVASKKDWDEFIGFPWTIYAGDPYWVPPLRDEVKKLLDVEKNPFFKHAYLYPLLAIKDGIVVGRVAGVIDDAHNQYHQEQTAFFGFFECINDLEVAKTLIDGIKKWAVEKGCNNLRGPMNPSTNHECGLLVEGFEDSPAVMMTYNPKYYVDLLEKCGFKKAKDLFAYGLNPESKFNDRLLKHAEKLKAKEGVVIRPVNVSKFDQEVDTILKIYNDAWEKNWGFVPMSPEEFKHMSKDMKPIMDPELLLIAEVRGKPAGFALVLPDINQALKKNPSGKLGVGSILKLLWNLKGPGRKKTLNRCRILTLGLTQEHRNLGLGPLFYTEIFKRGPGNGYPNGEASWILEDNVAMNRGLEMMGAVKTKTYRIYDLPIQ